jgi:hypothetical protein
MTSRVLLVRKEYAEIEITAPAEAREHPEWEPFIEDLKEECLRMEEEQNGEIDGYEVVVRFKHDETQYSEWEAD